MKYFGPLFVFHLFQAAAFHAPNLSVIRTTALNSTPGNFGAPRGFNENDRSMNNPSASGIGGPLQSFNNPRRKMHEHGKNTGKSTLVKVQGGSLRTWSFSTSTVERVQVILKTGGRPMNADIDLWHGPDNCPQKMAVYIENGALRPFNSVIETPGSQNAVAIRNTATLEYPLEARVEASFENGDFDPSERLTEMSSSIIVQGGAIKTFAFGSPVESIHILLTTDGRPLNAKIELLQGPNNNKQVIDIYTEDGLERPFYCVIKTPGNGNVVRLLNTATLEYPLRASVEPLDVADGFEFDGNSGKPGWGSTNDASFYFLGGK